MNCTAWSTTWLACVLVIFISFVSLPVGAVRCDEHCLPYAGCKVAGQCSGPCEDKYRLVDHHCVPRCGGNCVVCPSYMQCTGCRIGYKPMIVNGQIECKLGGCDPNCHSDCKYYLQCNGPCDSGYTLNTVTKKCDLAITCDPYCSPVSCTTFGADTCDATCLQGHYLDGTTHVCGDCDPNCAQGPPTCTSGGICGDGSAGTCKTGYIINTNTGMCDACSGACTSCTSPGTCSPSGCNPANELYVSASQTCGACGPHCLSGCVTLNYCNKVTGSAMQCDGYTASPQSPGYGFTSTNRCGLCDANCDSGCRTKGASRCDTSCSPGYLYSSTTFTCLACQTPNPSNCADCTVAGTCTSCAGSYTLAAGVCS